MKKFFVTDWISLIKRKSIKEFDCVNCHRKIAPKTKYLEYRFLEKRGPTQYFARTSRYCHEQGCAHNKVVGIIEYYNKERLMKNKKPEYYDKKIKQAKEFIEDLN